LSGSNSSTAKRNRAAYASVQQPFDYSGILNQWHDIISILSYAGEAIPDPEGDELAGDKEAHAKMVAREMLERRHWYKRGLEHWACEITSENDRKVGVVRFSK
jgi:hypothetical protein